MHRLPTLLIALTVLIALATSCQHDPLLIIVDPDPPVDTTGTPVDSCDSDSVYFLNDVLPIIQSNCAFAGCHGDGSAQDGIDLSTYSSIITTGEITPFDPGDSKLYEAITETDPDKIMPPPPAAALTPDQISTIAQWISQGALENSCDACDTTAVTFSLVVSPIIQNSCQGCHSGAAPAGTISLTNHSQIQTQALSGALTGSIKHESGFVAMPFNQPQLSQCKIDQISIWVADGAPDN